MNLYKERIKRGSPRAQEWTRYLENLKCLFMTVILRGFVVFKVLALPSAAACHQKYPWADKELLGSALLPSAQTDGHGHTCVHIERFNLEKGHGASKTWRCPAVRTGSLHRPRT